MQERKKKELDELNATLAELGLVPKDSEASGVEGAAGAEAAAATGKKKKKKDKSAAKDAETAAVNGNGVAPVQQSTPVEEPQNGQEDAPVIEVGHESITDVRNVFCKGQCLLRNTRGEGFART